MVGPLGFEPRACGSGDFDGLADDKNTIKTAPEAFGTVLEDFMKFMKVDLHLAVSSARRHKGCLRKVLASCGQELTAVKLRDFLAEIENPSTYNNYLKTLRIYCRDFLGNPEPIRTFRFARIEFCPARMFTKKDLQRFYSALDTPKERAIFLMYASSGRRRAEILNLTLDQIDFDNRVIPPNKLTRTKRTWYSFFNDECKEALLEYLEVRQDPKRSKRLFPLGSGGKNAMFRMAQCETGLRVTPQTLRFWFANEMARMGVADRFIDAFQGRVPRSILAMHYTDYSLDSLKQVYDKAGLRVLS
jgi:integrase